MNYFRGVKKEEWFCVIVAVLSVIGIPLYLYLQNRYFFFIDDKVDEYIPKLLDIARIIKSGDFPFLTTGFMNGSVYAAEFQEGIFNPIILASSLFLDSFDNLALGACWLAIFYSMISFAGFLQLAKKFGVTLCWSVVYALSMVFNCFVVYWYMTAWFNPIQGMAFLPYTLNFALAMGRKITLGRTVMFAVSAFLTVSAGWPMTILIMCLFLVFTLIDCLFFKKNTCCFCKMIGIYFGTALLCSVPVLPLVMSSEMFTRMSGLWNKANFLVGSLRGLLMFSFPYFRDFMHTWDGYAKLPFSNYYAAWYLLPLLVFMKYERISLKKSYLWLLATMTVFSGFATLGPEQLGSIRFPIRMLQYYHMFGTLFILLLVQKSGLICTKLRLWLLFVLIITQSALAWQTTPGKVDAIFGYAIIVTMLSALVYRILTCKGKVTYSAPFVLVGTLVLLLMLYRGNHYGRGYSRNIPVDRSSCTSLAEYGDYILFNGVGIDRQKKFMEFRPTTTGLLCEERQINGYSPLGNKRLRSRIPIDDHGYIDTSRMPGKGKELFAIDRETGKELLELMRVEKIISLNRGREKHFFGRLGGSNWENSSGKYTSILSHKAYRYPGSISWYSENISAKEIGSSRTNSEVYRVRNEGSAEERIVFSRMWWPGYRATLSGTLIPVEPYADFLLSVVVPAQKKGILKVYFRPPGFYLSLVLAGIGGLLIALVLLVPNSVCEAGLRSATKCDEK